MHGIGRLVIALSTSLWAVGCAEHHAPGTQSGGVSAPTSAVDFENRERRHVHVYLVGPTREWLLGRVDPLGRARLRVPNEALATDVMMAIVVIAGGATTPSAKTDPRAAFSLKQPSIAFSEQRWVYTFGQLVPVLASSGRD
jgi:hypothetical protein